MDLQSDKTTGYHLFLEPMGALKEELAGIISALAQEYGGPIFPPHVTLLHIPAGDEADVAAKAAQLASEARPLTLTLGPLNVEPVYFRSLYSIIREQPELRALHSRANELFSLQDQTPYLAHLSLLYGNYEHDRKVQTKSTLRYPVDQSFVAESIYLYRTEGTASEWRKIKEFPLGA